MEDIITGEIAALLAKADADIQALQEQDQQYGAYLLEVGCSRVKVGNVTAEGDFILLADAEAVADGRAWQDAADEESAAYEVTLQSEYASGTAVLVAPSVFGDLPVYMVRDAAGRLLRIEISIV
jgi:hypothetical protein